MRHNDTPVATMPARGPVIAGIVLAAGLSRRFGRNKLIEPFRGKPLLRWVVEAALGSQLTSVNVVLGFERDRVGAAIGELMSDPRLTVTLNRSYREGQSSSVVAGIAAIPRGCDGVMFLVGDQPLIDHFVIDRLISAFARANGGICFPVKGDQRCNPVIFGSAYLPQLLQLKGDRGGRVVIDDNRDMCTAIEFSDAVQFHDVDRPGDVAALASAANIEDGAFNLVRALGLERSRVIALCGSGGKTSLMAALVRAYASDPAERILATTTTKLGADELDGPWQTCQADGAEDILAKSRDCAGPVLAYRSLDRGRGRLWGFPPDVIDELPRADHYTRIVVEADGSRRRPLKAPNTDEPAFPTATDTVIAVAGLSGIGRPLNDDTVFRPENWSALTGLAAGSDVTTDSLARAIAHPDGLMRGAPARARRIVFLNQADTWRRLTLANSVVDGLAALHRQTPLHVAIGRLKPDLKVHAVHEIALQAQDDSREWK